MEAIRIIASVVGGIAFLWALAAAAAFAFHHWGQRLAPRSRMIFAALAVGMLLALVPLVAIIGNEGFSVPGIIAIVTMLIGGVFMSALCLPATWWVIRRLEHGDDRPVQTFE